LLWNVETRLVRKEPAGTHLDPDQLDAVKRILKRSGVTNPNAAQVLARAVAATMSQHIAVKDATALAMPDRQILNRLRALLRLTEQPDPPVGQMRARLKGLPQQVLAEVEGRAERRWSIYFDEPAPSRPTIGWLADVPADKLPKILPPSISNGGMTVPGRERGSGRRSRPHYERMIRGVVRGSKPSSKSAATERTADRCAPTAKAGGRPRDDHALELIAFLAMDWALATEERPTPGRSDKTPFGDLVHQVFGWLGLSDATAALRRYWRECARRAERGSLAARFD
jgi:hypothetical protein